MSYESLRCEGLVAGLPPIASRLLSLRLAKVVLSLLLAERIRTDFFTY